MKGWLQRLALSLLASFFIYVVIYLLLHTVYPKKVLSLSIQWGSPRFLYALTALPIFVGLLPRWYSLARMITLAAGLVALAQPAQQSSQVAHRSVVILADVSHSISDVQLQRGAQWIHELQGLLHTPDSLQVVTFAQTASLLSTATLTRPAEPTDLYTDVAAAVRMARGLHPVDSDAHEILLSDGNQTQGNVLGEANASLPIHYAPVALQAEQQPEVLVTSLDATEGVDDQGRAHIGKPFFLTAELRSNLRQPAQVILWQGSHKNQEQPEQSIELQPGKQSVRFRTIAREVGTVPYRVEVRATRDQDTRNNQIEQVIQVQGPPRVLYVEGEFSTRSYLEQALSRASIHVETRPTAGFPNRFEELNGYDALIVSDISGATLRSAQKQWLEQYVHQGGGLLFAAGEHVLPKTTSNLDGLLPVRFQQTTRQEQPSVALVLCIDRSGSMNGPKLEMAKDAARITADALGPTDLIAVVAFDSQATSLVPLQAARNRIRISSDIARLTSGGGTQLLPPLQEALQQLQPANAAVKHIILLTDGYAEPTGVVDLINQMRQQHITLTTVGIGHGADQTFLDTMAQNGGGRFYFTENASSLPQIFLKDTKQIQQSAYQEQPTRAFVKKSASFLQGIAFESAPVLRGYLFSQPKAGSETLLAAQNGDPLLVRWRQGLGTVVAFTSDIKNRWSAEWLKWPGYATLWAQLTRSLLRHNPEKSAGSYQIRATIEPPRLHLWVSQPEETAVSVEKLQASVMPSRSPQSPMSLWASTSLQQTGPGLFEALVPLPTQAGPYEIRVRSVSTMPLSQGTVSVGSAVIPYPAERLALPPNEELLRTLALQTGGRRLEKPSDLLQLPRKLVVIQRPLWPWCVLASIFLLIADLAVRRWVRPQTQVAQTQQSAMR